MSAVTLAVCVCEACVGVCDCLLVVGGRHLSVHVFMYVSMYVRACVYVGDALGCGPHRVEEIGEEEVVFVASPVERIRSPVAFKHGRLLCRMGRARDVISWMRSAQSAPENTHVARLYDAPSL
jgi:hypothetical protein